MSQKPTFPEPGMAMTSILVVDNMEESMLFYSDILGAKLYREYGGTSAVYEFLDQWILLVTGGGPTADKPSVTFQSPSNPDLVDKAFTIRVEDCNRSYQVLKARGAKFITPPHDWGAEIRCFFRDPDGHLFEISEAIGN